MLQHGALATMYSNAVHPVRLTLTQDETQLQWEMQRSRLGLGKKRPSYLCLSHVTGLQIGHESEAFKILSTKEREQVAAGKASHLYS